MRVWSRADWGARPPKSVTPITPPQTMAVVHHTVTEWPATPDAAAEWCRTIQAWHQDGNGWADIGYSWLVGAGDVYEGRGWGVQQAAQQGYNATALSFAILGDGSSRTASPADLAAVAQTIRAGIALGQLPTDVLIVGHRDLNATACCGDAIYSQLPELRQLVYNGGPVSPTEEIVAQLYRLWCLREGDPGGIAYWAGEIDAGRVDAQYVAMDMLYREGWQRMVERTGGPA